MLKETNFDYLKNLDYLKVSHFYSSSMYLRNLAREFIPILKSFRKIIRWIFQI